ncbi:MAG TPA: hypothetical protein DCL83_05720, partial [Arthrobacter bacterium]|nr:hypothetical protein [Arthrobacter sp.]
MRDESYEAGYRAGHLQGWLDAVAKLQASGQPGPAVTESPSSGAADLRPVKGTTAAASSAPTPPAPVPADVSISVVPAAPLAKVSPL